MGRSPQSQVYHLVENEAPSQGFSAEPRETFKNNFFTKHLQTTASETTNT